jgi:hypothetical protein
MLAAIVGDIEAHQLPTDTDFKILEIYQVGQLHRLASIRREYFTSPAPRVIAQEDSAASVFVA